MGLFKRRAIEPVPFWRSRPIRTADPTVLYQYGITSISGGNGPGAMATGWSLWELAGLHEFQAWDFLTDGYRNWQSSADFDRSVAKRFLTDVLDRLGNPPPAPWPDLYAVPSEVVEPVAAVHSAICWTCSELLEVVDGIERDLWERRAFESIASARHDFVPPRSIAFATTYAAAHGLPPPWG